MGSLKIQHGPIKGGLLTKNKSDSPALPWSQQHEGMRQPFHERGPLEVVMVVVGMAVNWLIAQVLQRNEGEGHNVDCSVTRQSRRVVHAVNRNHIRMIDGCVSLDGFQTEQLSETVGNVYRSVAHGVARAAARLGGRSDLDAIQAIFPANGRRG